MSTAARSLLSELSARGISVRVEGAYLRLCPSAPPDLLDRVRAAKPELITLLSRPEPLDQGLAVREVSGFPSHLLAELPLATTLIAEDRAGRRRHLPPTSPEWAAMAQPGLTVAAVLSRQGLRLRAVLIDGGLG